MEVMKSVWRWWWWGLASYEIGGFTGTGRKKRHRHCSLRVWHWAQCLRNDEIAEEEEVYWQLQASLSHLSVTVLRQIKTSTTTTALSPSIKSVSCARHLVVVVVVVSPHCCWSLPKASGLKCVCVCSNTFRDRRRRSPSPPAPPPPLSSNHRQTYSVSQFHSWMNRRRHRNSRCKWSAVNVQTAKGN